MIEIFSAHWCSECAVVKRALTAAGVDYIERDIDNQDVMIQAKELGIRGIPVTRILVDGEVVESVVGASRQAVNRIVELSQLKE